MNDKTKQEDARNKSLPRLPIYDFKNDQFVVRKDSEEKDCFICLAPQQDDEWHRNFKSFFDPDNTVATKGVDSPYLRYCNPLYRFFVSKALENVESFRAEKIYSQEIKNSDKNNTQAWKGADVHLYDETDLGKIDYSGTHQKNGDTNGFMQSLALYKPYLCDDKHLSTIISAALRFYKDGWRIDNSPNNTLRKCNDPIDKDNEKQYINLKYVAHLLAFAIEARRLPDVQNGQLKGYDEIQPIKLEGDLLDQVIKAIKTKMEEVLNSEGNTNKLSFEQIGEKFKKIREHEKTIKTKQQKYKKRLLEILENGKKSIYGKDVTDEIAKCFRMADSDSYNYLISSIKNCELEQVINRLTIKTDKSFHFKCFGTKEVYNHLLTKTQKEELDNLAEEIKTVEDTKKKLYEEIGPKRFHHQLKELDEIREHMTFFCKHSKSDLSKFKQILNAICSIIGYKPFKGEDRLELKQNPFDLINETLPSEQKPQMSKQNKGNDLTLT